MTQRLPLRLAAAALVAGLLSASAVQAAPYRPRLGVPQAAAKTAFFADGRKIMLSLDGGKASPFFIKGVDYAPSPICSGPLDNPLGDANKAIWERDLPNLRALNLNAVKVYNVDLNVGPIDQFLTRAYNGGTKPIYVVLSIFFQGAAVLNPDAAADLGRQYERLMQTYGTFPAVMGVSISSEVNASTLVTNPAFWAGMNTVVAGARRGLAAANARKIVTTSMVDAYDGDTKIWNPITYGEKNGFNIDAWGINVYRGASFAKAHLWEQVNSYTTKPFLLGEWGTPESWHPNGDPNVAVEWPQGKIDLLTSYIRGLDQDLYQNSTVNGGVNSGGFYFEYSDEWWKAERGNNCEHLPNGVPNGNFPGGFNDEGWYGLNSIKAGVGNKPNVLSKRDPYFTLQTDFSQQ